GREAPTADPKSKIQNPKSAHGLLPGVGCGKLNCWLNCVNLIVRTILAGSSVISGPLSSTWRTSESDWPIHSRDGSGAVALTSVLRARRASGVRVVLRR